MFWHTWSCNFLARVLLVCPVKVIHTLHKITADYSDVSKSEWDLLQTLSQCVPLPPCCLWKGGVLRRSLSSSTSMRKGQREFRVPPAWEASLLPSLALLLVISVLLNWNWAKKNGVSPWYHKHRQIVCHACMMEKKGIILIHFDHCN